MTVRSTNIRIIRVIEKRSQIQITKSPESYPYSSFAYYTSGRQDGLVTEDIFFEGLGQNAVERQNEYRKLVVSEVIQESYPKESWGSSNQRYN